MSGIKTRFPLTVYLLRCQWDDLTGREGRKWTDMIADLIASGDADCVKPAVEATRQRLWLFAGDPR